MCSRRCGAWPKLRKSFSIHVVHGLVELKLWILDDRNELTTEFIKVMKETQKYQYHKAFSAKKGGEKTISDWEPWWGRGYPYFACVNFYRAPE